MPEKMGNTFLNTDMVTPLNADAGKGDPGPKIMNNPLMKPDDDMGFLTEVTKPGGKKGK